MPKRISQRVEALLETVLALKRDLEEDGHRFESTPRDLLQEIAREPEGLGPQPVAEPYRPIVPGFVVGFQAGTTPEVHLRARPDRSLEMVLKQPTESGWLTMEIDCNPAIPREKGRVSLLIRGVAKAPATLGVRLRRIGADGTAADFPGRDVTLGPASAFDMVDLDVDAAEAEVAGIWRVLLFYPLQPFNLRLTELSLR